MLQLEKPLGHKERSYLPQPRPDRDKKKKKRERERECLFKNKTKKMWRQIQLKMG